MKRIGNKNGKGFYHRSVIGADQYHIWWEPDMQMWCVYGLGSEEKDYYKSLTDVQALFRALKM